MQLNKNIAVSDSGFIFNPSTGDSFSTNTIGGEIIQMLKENKDKEEIIQKLLEDYLVDKSTLEKDLQDFIQMLTAHYLLKNE
ncbi:MAG: PqqD family protein [Bacteroidia bacterium]|nr:PqqD family protein [Bacteroidia bacterium]